VSKLYQRLIAALADRAINCYFQREGQLVVSTQRGPAWPFAGNSFWVTRKSRRWYLCTWTPVCYAVPPSTDFASLCAEFVGRGRCAQSCVHDDLVQKYDLRQLDDREFVKIFG